MRRRSMGGGISARSCGTGLFYTSEAIFPGQIDVQIATLDDPDAFVPQAQIQTAERIGWMEKLELDAAVRALSGAVRGTDCGDFGKVPTVVPNIPVIHRLEHAFFASPTRRRGALFKGDRDGSPRLHRKARKGQKEAEGDGRTDLRRQAMRNSSEVRRASREEAPEELIFL